jgi:16S rRNA (cytosine1402-N4)-methyltransferase
MKIPHIPVLESEIVETFKDIKSGYIVDCTLGYGGHSEAILKSNPLVKMVCIDRDKEAIEFSKRRLEPFIDRVEFSMGSFSQLFKSLKDREIKGVLADIGVSSLQLDKKSRGFGFDSEVLDMRMDQSSPLDAKIVVNEYPQSELERIFRDYGEIREYKKLSSLIVKERDRKRFESSKELSDFISKNFNSRSKIHPATLAFQAIRIEVNDELGELSRLLDSLEDLHSFNTLVAIISFHSLEDRIVKERFKRWSRSCICPKEAYRCSCGGDNSLGEIITKKPITPTGKEIARNPRSRSSKLRIFRFK